MAGPDLADIIADRRTIDVDLWGRHVSVTYRPALITVRWQLAHTRGSDPADVLPEIVAEWALTTGEMPDRRTVDVELDGGYRWQVTYSPARMTRGWWDTHGVRPVHEALAAVVLEWDVMFAGEPLAIDAEALEEVAQFPLLAMWRAVLTDFEAGAGRDGDYQPGGGPLAVDPDAIRAGGYAPVVDAVWRAILRDVTLGKAVLPATSDGSPERPTSTPETANTST